MRNEFREEPWLREKDGFAYVERPRTRRWAGAIGACLALVGCGATFAAITWSAQGSSAMEIEHAIEVLRAEPRPEARRAAASAIAAKVRLGIIALREAEQTEHTRVLLERIAESLR